MKTKAVSYSRFSSDGQDVTSIERQEELAKRWAANNGVEIVKFFKDEAVSSKEGKNLERDLGKAVDYIRSHKDIQYLLVEDPDRLSRETPLIFVSKFSSILLETSITIVQTSSGHKWDPSQGMDFLNLMMKQYLASEENKKKSERVKEAYTRRFKEGSASPKMPFGYKRVNGKVLIEPEHAKIIKHIFQLCAAGTPYMSIVRTLNKEKAIYPGMVFIKDKTRPYGDGWNIQTVRRMLLSTTYFDGTQKQKRGIMKGAFPQIIDADLWHKTRARINSISRVQTATERFNTGKVGNLFSDLLFCSDCGSKYHIKSAPSELYRAYQCSLNIKGKCKNPTRFNVIQFEKIILQRLVKFIDTGEYGKLIEMLESQHTKNVDVLASEEKRLEKDHLKAKAILDGLVEKYALAQGPLAETLLDNINRKQNDLNEISQALAEVRNQRNQIEADSGLLLAEIGKDVESLKSAIVHGWNDYNIKLNPGKKPIEQYTEKEFVAEMMQYTPKEFVDRLKKADEQTDAIALQARVQLKSAVRDLIERIELSEDGECKIVLKTERIDSLNIGNALSHTR